MKSKFALSFGISLIFVGVLNIFWETSSIVLLGLSISSLLFSLISIMFTFISLYNNFEDDNNSKLEWIYIIPFIILISIFCYSNSLTNYKFINNIVNSNLVNVLTFVSFGLLFVGEFLNHIKEVSQERYRFLSIIGESVDDTSLILEVFEKYQDILNEKESNIEELRLLSKIKQLCKEKIEKNNIELKFLELNKDNYSLNDIEKILAKNIKKEKNQTKRKNKY